MSFDVLALEILVEFVVVQLRELGNHFVQRVVQLVQDCRVPCVFCLLHFLLEFSFANDLFRLVDFSLCLEER